MSLKGHNKSQEALVQKLINDQQWYLSEQLGYDCTKSATGICMLNNRVSLIIAEGFGEWMANLEETEQI